MADLAYRNESWAHGRSTDWGAIWAGVFTFAAIWSVFETLGEAIFSSSASADAVRAGIGVGIGIWSIVLAIIAMFVAGRVTADLARLLDHGRKLFHANAMFGLSIVVAVVLMALGRTVLNSGNSGSGGYALTPLSDWVGFVALFLGWLAAMGGASSGAKSVARASSENLREMHPAA